MGRDPVENFAGLGWRDCSGAGILMNSLVGTFDEILYTVMHSYGNGVWAKSAEGQAWVASKKSRRVS